MLPNFLIIGGQRCGTTWIHNCLLEHPEVFVSSKKELHFFDVHFEKGLNYYKSFFNQSQFHRAIGEATPEYLYKKDVPKRIFETLQDVKFIAILRNPADRAFSAYNMFKGKFKGMPFEEAIKKSKALLNKGLYYEQLLNYKNYFPFDRFLILIFDDLQRDDIAVSRNIFQFLEIDTNFIPSISNKAVNMPIFPKTQDLLLKMNLGFLIEFIKKTSLDSFFRKIYKSHRLRKPLKISPEARQFLTEFYRVPNQKLGKLIGKDLSNWSEPKNR
jgi:hypothetical protein